MDAASIIQNEISIGQAVQGSIDALGSLDLKELLHARPLNAALILGSAIIAYAIATQYPIAMRYKNGETEVSLSVGNMVA